MGFHGGGSSGGGGVFLHIPGQYYNPPGYDTSFHSASPTLSQEWAVPFPVSDSALTLTSLVIRMASAIGSSTFRIGIRAALTSGAPGSVLYDSGALNTNVSGNVITSGLSVALSSPLVWVTGTAQGVSPDIYTMALSGTLLAPWQGANPNFGASFGLYQTGVTGALPNTFTIAGYLTAQPARILLGF